jgi:hypothetical protein
VGAFLFSYRGAACIRGAENKKRKRSAACVFVDVVQTGSRSNPVDFTSVSLFHLWALSFRPLVSKDNPLRIGIKITYKRVCYFLSLFFPLLSCQKKHALFGDVVKGFLSLPSNHQDSAQAETNRAGTPRW